MDASIERELEKLRTENAVRPVTPEEGGTGIDHLPPGVYGFTYSPAEDNFPLFAKRDPRSFEAHKLGNGSALLVGWVTQGDSLQMSAGREAVTIHLFPEPQDEANALVVVPMARVLRHKEHSQRTGKGLELTIGPVS